MLAALSPARRRLVLVLFLVLAMVLVLTVTAVTMSRRSSSRAAPAVNESYAGPVLLIPGYGGSRTGLLVLARHIQRAGRQAEVMTLPGGGTGDLHAQAKAVAAAAVALKVRTKAQSIDVVGYSAGGIVARLWASEDGGDRMVRRIVTLGSPHHGTELAALGALFASACPLACQQLAPDSSLLATIDSAIGASTGMPNASIVSVWSTTDDVVIPPASAELPGAVNVTVQSVCPSSQVKHGALPTDPTAVGIVLAELAPGAPPALGSADCSRLSGS
jgi:triacylglycerol esterase/lipase EstA (alpha/beta hydrolase family)